MNNKSKICIFLAGLGYGGVGRVYTELAPLLGAKFDLDIILFDGSRFDYDKFNKGIRKIHILLPKGGFRFYSPVLIFKTFRNFYYIVKSEKYDLIVSSGHFENLLCMIFSGFFNYKTILTHHEDLSFQLMTKWSFLTTFLRKLIYKACIKRAAANICVSEGVRWDLINSLEIMPEKCYVINNPINIIKIKESCKEQLIEDELQWFNGNNFHFISAGRFVEAKNYPLLIKAFAEALSKEPNIRLTILGDGAARAEIQRHIKEFDITEQINLPGYKKSIYSYFYKADCFVLSSTWEGFGNVIVEAMACGKPVIAADCSGSLDILKDNQDDLYGVLIPRNNVKALADAMIKMVHNREHLEKYTELSLKRCQAFEDKVISEKYIELIYKIIGS